MNFKLFDDFDLLVKFFRILGLCPLKGDWSMSIPWFIYSLVVHAVYMTLVVLFYFFYYYRYFDNNLMKVVSFVVTITNCFSLGVTFYYCLSKIQVIHSVLESLEPIRYYSNRRGCISKSYLFFLVADIIIFFFCLCIEWAVTAIDIKIAFIYCMFIYLNLSIKRFTGLLQPLNLLTGTLAPLVAECKSVNNLIKLSRIYVTLEECCFEINGVFSLPLFIYFSTCFCHLINALFAFRIFMDSCISDGKCYLALWCLYLTVSLFLNLISLVYECTSVAEKAKNFNNALFERMISEKNEEGSNEALLRLHMLTHKTVTFTAYGFFNLDFTLIHSIVAAITTYLLLLIQFS